jgi:hypothetical protein
MRELIFKNLTSEDKRRRDLYISETLEKDGVKTVTQRHSIYVINSHNKFNSPKELMQWQSNVPADNKMRHIFICKKHDTKLKTDTFVCDVVGKFYAVIKNEVYSIGFKHSFEIDFSVADEHEEGGDFLGL